MKHLQDKFSFQLQRDVKPSGRTLQGMRSVSIKNTKQFTQYKEVISFRYDDKHMKHINAHCSNTQSFFVLQQLVRTDNTGNLAVTVKFGFGKLVSCVTFASEKQYYER